MKNNLSSGKNEKLPKSIILPQQKCQGDKLLLMYPRIILRKLKILTGNPNWNASKNERTNNFLKILNGNSNKLLLDDELLLMSPRIILRKLKLRKLEPFKEHFSEAFKVMKHCNYWGIMIL